MKPEHLDLLRVPGRPSPHPEQEWAVVAITRPDLEADAYRSRLWRVGLDGTSFALTSGPRDGEPVVSPDGHWIAFLRGGDGGPQLAVLDARGGEPVVLTSHALGVSGRPVWSPDSTRIAYVAAVPAAGRYGTEPDVAPAAEPARHITELTYRMDGQGFTRDKPTHVHVIAVPRALVPADAEAEEVVAVRLTDGPLPFASPAWLPDGRTLLASRGQIDALADDLVRLEVPDTADDDGGADDGAAAPSAPATDTKAANKAAAKAARAARRRDGVLAPVPVTVIDLGRPGLTLEAFGVAADHLVLLLADLGEGGLGFIGTNPALVRARLEGDALAEVQWLTDPEVHDLAGGTGEQQLQVLADGAVLARRVRRGRTELVRIATDGEIEVLHPGSVIGAVARPDGRILASATLPESPGEVLLIEPATLDASSPDGVTRLTDLASALAAKAPTRPSLVLEGAAPDGYPLHGWLVLPDPVVHGPGPYPVLLSIHGGPYAAYEDVFFDEVQVAAGAGYAVVYGNPRGSAGYGSAHGRAVVGGFGTVDADDVVALLDAAIAGHPELDTARIGVMGGSYGGYMTAWLTTKPEFAARVRGAIVERGFLDPVSFTGSSDIGWFFGLEYLGTDPELVAAQSPMAHLGAVTTPTLVIHSEHDWRCPVEQGQRWYVGLKRQGVEAELLLFPGEGHELSRSGRPKHRLQRFAAVLDWWERQLG